ncbi:MAG: histidine kinase [Bacteroidota bacterium]
MKNRSNYIWLIVISAIIITILANIGLFNNFHKLHNMKEFTPQNGEQYYFTVRIGFVGVVTELIMLVVFAFFNYSWKDRFFVKDNTLLTIMSNLLILALFMGIDMFIFRYVTKTHPNLVLSWSYLKDYLINHSLVLTIAIVAPYMLLRMEKVREMELNLNKLKEEKSIAELSALKEQISPHFFFNTMSTLSSIVRSDTKEASLDFIDDISKTYRYSLSSSKTDLVKLKDELDFIRSYALLLQKRFGQKLTINEKISEEIYHSHIPPMSIQLLVENAIQHNIITSQKPLNIDIYNSVDFIFVKNNLQERETVDSFGIGLMNLNNRYKLIADKEIHIEEKSDDFVVKLPVLL